MRFEELSLCDVNVIIIVIIYGYLICISYV